jgi:hypothetical protein
MPATIIGNSEWTSRGLVLTAQDAQEQVNGLVNVQVTYVGPSSRHDEISRSFYLDAPPPIFPSVVNPSELVTGRLFMTDRSVNRANGLTTVQASYVGGLQRSGFNGYFLSEQQEQGKRAKAVNYFEGTTLTSTTSTGTTSSMSVIIFAPVAFSPSGTPRNATLSNNFLYDERIKVVEFVRVAGTAAAKLPTFVRSDLVSIVRFQADTFNYGAASTEGPPDPLAADLWVVDGPEDILKFGQRSFERDTLVPSTESSTFVTPTVEIVSLTFRLSR